MTSMDANDTWVLWNIQLAYSWYHIIVPQTERNVSNGRPFGTFWKRPRNVSETFEHLTGFWNVPGTFLERLKCPPIWNVSVCLFPSPKMKFLQKDKRISFLRIHQDTNFKSLEQYCREMMMNLIFRQYGTRESSWIQDSSIVSRIFPSDLKSTVVNTRKC